jgi:hypothetical protein
MVDTKRAQRFAASLEAVSPRCVKSLGDALTLLGSREFLQLVAGTGAASFIDSAHFFALNGGGYAAARILNKDLLATASHFEIEVS